VITSRSSGNPEATGSEPAGLFFAHRHEALRARDQVAGPHRLVEDGGVLGHDRLGQLEASLEVEVDLQGQLLDRATGRPVVRPEPRGEQHQRRHRTVGDLVGDGVVPEQGVGVLDRRRAGPEVPALHRELADLLVLQLPDQRVDVGR
jgi:hypothetical protein